MQVQTKWYFEGVSGETPAEVRQKLGEKAAEGWAACEAAIVCAGGLGSGARLGAYRRETLKEYVQIEEKLHECSRKMKPMKVITFDSAHGANPNDARSITEALTFVEGRISIRVAAVSATETILTTLIKHVRALEYWANCAIDLKKLKEVEDANIQT